MTTADPRAGVLDFLRRYGLLLDGETAQLTPLTGGVSSDLWKVELPVALPTIMAGVRVATVSTVALVTVGVLVGEGGLGQLILRGFNNNFYRAEILTASVLTVALGLTFDLLLAGATRLMTPWSRRRT